MIARRSVGSMPRRMPALGRHRDILRAPHGATICGIVRTIASATAGPRTDSSQAAVRSYRSVFATSASATSPTACRLCALTLSGVSSGVCQYG